MSKKIKDFIQDWNVNVKDLSAMHRTGVGFKKILTHSNNPEIEVLNMPEWMHKQMAKGDNFDECEDKLSLLQDEFEIIDQTMFSCVKQRVISLNRGDR